MLRYYDRNNYISWLKKNPEGKIRENFMSTLIRDDRYRGKYSVFLRPAIKVGHPEYVNMTRESKQKIDLIVPRLISDEDWDLVIKKRTSRAIKSKRNTIHDYLVRDVLVCNECGSPMSARPKWPKKRFYEAGGELPPSLYYVCKRRVRSDGSRCKATKCHAAPKLDANVFEEIKKYILGPKIVQVIDQSQRSFDPPESIQEYENALMTLAKKILTLDEENKRNNTNLNKGILSDTEYLDEKNRITKERKDIEKSQVTLTRKINGIKSACEHQPIVDFEKVKKQFSKRIESLSFEEKKTLVTTLVHQVRISPDRSIKLLLRPIR